MCGFRSWLLRGGCCHAGVAWTERATLHRMFGEQTWSGLCWSTCIAVRSKLRMFVRILAHALLRNVCACRTAGTDGRRRSRNAARVKAVCAQQGLNCWQSGRMMWARAVFAPCGRVPERSRLRLYHFINPRWPPDCSRDTANCVKHTAALLEARVAVQARASNCVQILHAFGRAHTCKSVLGVSHCDTDCALAAPLSALLLLQALALPDTTAPPSASPRASAAAVLAQQGSLRGLKICLGLAHLLRLVCARCRVLQARTGAIGKSQGPLPPPRRHDSCTQPALSRPDLRAARRSDTLQPGAIAAPQRSRRRSGHSDGPRGRTAC
jgi:hypothetical protein